MKSIELNDRQIGLCFESLVQVAKLPGVPYEQMMELGMIAEKFKVALTTPEEPTKS